MIRSVEIFLLIFCWKETQEAILSPQKIEPLMFTESITGIPDVLISSNEKHSFYESYEIEMKKTKQQILPHPFPQTTIYAYGGATQEGRKFTFPGPIIRAYKDRSIRVKWINSISGKHFLPVDYSQPFINNTMFKNQVPVVPHAHGIATRQSSDGEPAAYWTASGNRSPDYNTEEECAGNEAIYQYPNEQDSGLFWYHDHTYGITRLNVYAGLAGFYEIVDENNEQENRIKQNYGDIQVRYLTIADKTFQQNGELYYPDEALSTYFTSWIPEFYGNTITVNGKVWPQILLSKKKYRLVFLNACQCRYLNIYFLNHEKKLSFELIRVQGDYYSQPIVTTEFLLSPGARLEIILDLTYVTDKVIMKNNAPAPYPDGDSSQLIDKFTGTILKIQIQQEKLVEIYNQLRQRKHPKFMLKDNFKYPAFEEGEHVYSTLIQLEDEQEQSVGMLIDGVSMELGKNCERSVFELDKVYDFFIINLTPDTHPIHMHLINFQKISSFSIDHDQYIQDWYQLNGGQPTRGGYTHIPQPLDPRPYQQGATVLPKPSEKVFRDMIDADPFSVTVFRVKFSHNNGKPFQFPVSGSRYVWHCHMLEHEDNEMMKYFCLK